MATTASSLTTPSIDPRSLYSLLVRNQPLITRSGKSLTRAIELPAYGWKEGTPISWDNGNFRLKSVMLDAVSNTLVNQAIIAATGPVPKTRTKVTRTMYRVRDVDTDKNFSGWFLIGRQAINYCPPDQLSLGVGSTGERLNDIRQLHFSLAALAETFKQAHYPAGSYHLVCGFGAPNEEFENGELSDESVDALSLINEHTFEVQRQEQGGEAETYRLIGAEIIPTPQTSGTFTALNYGIDGSLLESTVEEEIYIDFGGGHTQEYRVSRILNDRHEIELVGTGGRLGVGKGSISISRVLLETLREKYPNLPLSDISSQTILADGAVRIHGVSHPLEEVIDISLLNTAAESLLTDTLRVLQQESSRVTFTGGGLSLDLLRNQLHNRADRRSEGVLFLETEWASVLNSYGIYLQALIDSSRRNRV